MAQSRWLQIDERGIQDGRPNWSVFVKGKTTWLGTVGWYGRWRRYVFFPETAMLFDAACLRELAEFMESQTQPQRAGSVTHREG